MTRKVTLDGELMFPNDFISAAEFKGKDVTLTVADINLDDLPKRDGKSEKKPVVKFKETPKKLVLNKTNADTIAALHGTEAKKWVGKKITLYPTRAMAFGEMVDCVRVRENGAASA